MTGTPTRVIIPPGIQLPKIPATSRVTGLQTHRQLLFLFLLLLLVWIISPTLIHLADPTADTTSQGIWILVILSLIVFLIILALCWWLLHIYLKLLGLPTIHSILSQLNNLSSWQQIIFLWVSFASLLLAVLGCLISIC